MSVDVATQARHEAIRQRAREVSARARLLALNTPESAAMAADYAALPPGHARWAADRGATAAEDTHDTLQGVRRVLEDIREDIHSFVRQRVEGPLSSWLEVARAVGVDDSTIREHRRRTADKTEPFFGSRDEARAWYTALVVAPDYVEGSKRPRKPRARSGAEITGAVDWSKVDV